MRSKLDALTRGIVGGFSVAQDNVRWWKRERTQVGLHHPVKSFCFRAVSEDHNLTATKLITVDLADTSGSDGGPRRSLGCKDQRPLVRLAEIIAAQMEASDHGMLRGVSGRSKSAICMTALSHQALTVDLRLEYPSLGYQQCQQTPAL